MGEERRFIWLRRIFAERFAKLALGSLSLGALFILNACALRAKFLSANASSAATTSPFSSGTTNATTAPAVYTADLPAPSNGPISYTIDPQGFVSSLKYDGVEYIQDRAQGYIGQYSGEYSDGTWVSNAPPTASTTADTISLTFPWGTVTQKFTVTGSQLQGDFTITNTSTKSLIQMAYVPLMLGIAQGPAPQQIFSGGGHVYNLDMPAGFTVLSGLDELLVSSANFGDIPLIFQLNETPGNDPNFSIYQIWMGTGENGYFNDHSWPIIPTGVGSNDNLDPSQSITYSYRVSFSSAENFNATVLAPNVNAFRNANPGNLSWTNRQIISRNYITYQGQWPSPCDGINPRHYSMGGTVNYALDTTTSCVSTASLTDSGGNSTLTAFQSVVGSGCTVGQPYAIGGPDSLVQTISCDPSTTAIVDNNGAVTVAGYEAVHQAMVNDANSQVAVMKAQNAQGTILWDMEGSYFYQPVTYIGDPRLLEIPYQDPNGVLPNKYMAPEMNSYLNANGQVVQRDFLGGNDPNLTPADEYFKIITDAGFNCGMTIRPTQVEAVTGFWGANQIDLPGTNPFSVSLNSQTTVANLIISKIDYARNRWGCKIFYVDSVTGIDERIFTIVHNHYMVPGQDDLVLLMPEYTSYQMLSHTMGFDSPSNGGGGTDSYGTAAERRALYPGAITFTQPEQDSSTLIPDPNNPGQLTYPNWQTIVDNLKQGDIVDSAWYFSSDNVIIKNLMDLVGPRPTIEISAPAPNSNYKVGSPANFSFTTNLAGGSALTKVEVFDNQNLVNAPTAPTYPQGGLEHIGLTSAFAGTHYIQVRITNTIGTQGFSVSYPIIFIP